MVWTIQARPFYWYLKDSPVPGRKLQGRMVGEACVRHSAWSRYPCAVSPALLTRERRFICQPKARQAMTPLIHVKQVTRSSRCAHGLVLFESNTVSTTSCINPWGNMLGDTSDDLSPIREKKSLHNESPPTRQSSTLSAFCLLPTNITLHL